MSNVINLQAIRNVICPRPSHYKKMARCWLQLGNCVEAMMEEMEEAGMRDPFLKTKLLETLRIARDSYLYSERQHKLNKEAS